MAAMHTTIIRASMTAYSTAAGPSSLLINLTKMREIRDIIQVVLSGPEKKTLRERGAAGQSGNNLEGQDRGPTTHWPRHLSAANPHNEGEAPLRGTTPLEGTVRACYKPERHRERIPGGPNHFGSLAILPHPTLSLPRGERAR